MIVNEIISIGNNRFNVNFKDNTGFIHNPHSLDGGKYISIGSNSKVGKFSWLGAFDNYFNQSFSPTIKIGDNVNIGNFACITAIDNITIANGCLFSEYVYISDHYHGHDAELGLSPTVQPLHSKGPIVIGENTFIGMRASILPGVSIGKHCVIGAHSIVSKSIPDYSMVAGAPAKVIKIYSFEKREWISIAE